LIPYFLSNKSAKNVKIIKNCTVLDQITTMAEMIISGGSRIFARGCGSWCLWSAPSPFMPSLPPTLSSPPHASPPHPLNPPLMIIHSSVDHKMRLRCKTTNDNLHVTGTPYSMQSRVCETLRCPSCVCLSIRLSHHGPTAANPLLQVWCRGPGGQEISIDCFNSGGRLVLIEFVHYY